MSIITTLGIVSLALVAWFTWHQAFNTNQGSGQSKRQSILEAWTNIGVGFSVNYTANLLLLPLVGAHLTAASNFWLGWIYTLVSVVRQFIIRRYFNDRIHAATKRLAGQ